MTHRRSYLDDNYGADAGSASTTTPHIGDQPTVREPTPNPRPPTVTRPPAHHSQPMMRAVGAPRGRGRPSGRY